MTHVAILGGGPAGVGAARELRRRGLADVTLIERNAFFGGNAGTFEHDGHLLDFGSHRLHPACDADILDDIKSLLGDELLDRPRHGRIRLLGRWVHFPLKPGDLLLHLDKRFALGSFADAVRRALPGGGGSEDNFATVLEGSLGKTICNHFYFPYAEKIWGRAPEELSAIQAEKRVSASSFLKLFRKVMGAVPGLKKPGAGRFWYPRGGYGRVTEVYAEDAARLGASLLTETNVERLDRRDDGWTVTITEGGGATRTMDFDHVWSTIPVTTLARLVRPEPRTEVLEAAASMQYRAMVLAYLELPVDRFTEFDAHYFPGTDIAMTRMSEPKNYAVRSEPAGRTVLCAEIPCDVGDDLWTRSDADLGAMMKADLDSAGLPLPAEPIQVFSRRLPQAYPIYLTGYESSFETLDAWADSLPNALTYGRQGLFAHDNTHHALAMAYGAADCLGADGTFDRARWTELRAEFAKHVVED